MLKNSLKMAVLLKKIFTKKFKNIFKNCKKMSIVLLKKIFTKISKTVFKNYKKMPKILC